MAGSKEVRQSALFLAKNKVLAGAFVSMHTLIVYVYRNNKIITVHMLYAKEKNLPASNSPNQSTSQAGPPPTPLSLHATASVPH